MSGDKDVDIDVDDDGDIDDDTAEIGVKLNGISEAEARRKLEARLEERRLNKLIQDYDFDFI